MAAVMGTLGVVLGTSLTASQWWRARSSAAGVSLATWSMYLALNVTAAVYGAGTSNAYLLVAGACAAGFNLALLWSLDARRWRPSALLIVVGTAALAVGGAVGWSLLVVAVGTLALTLRWPQIRLLVREPDVSGVSAATWCVALANNLVWVASSWARGDLWWGVFNALVAVVTVVLLAMLVARRRGWPGQVPAAPDGGGLHGAGRGRP